MATIKASAEAGWNQTADDWRMVIDGGEAIGFEDKAGRLVARHSF